MFADTLIRFTNKVGENLWVKGASFKDEPGYKVKSVTFTRVREQAARFRGEVADEIANQFFNNLVATEKANGGLVKDYSAEHRVKAAAYYKAMREHQDELIAEFKKALSGLNLGF